MFFAMGSVSCNTLLVILPVLRWWLECCYHIGSYNATIVLFVIYSLIINMWPCIMLCLVYV